MKNGVQKGDLVVIYMPMVPQAMFTMLACARIGAPHSLIFGGFASKELSVRIDHAKVRILCFSPCIFFYYVCTFVLRKQLICAFDYFLSNRVICIHICVSVSVSLKTVTQSKQTATFLKQMLFLLFCFSHVYASTLLI